MTTPITRPNKITDIAEEARQNLAKLDQQLAKSNEQALAEEARQNLERLDQQLAKSNKQALAKEASENLERLDQQLAESNKQALAQGKLQDRARIDEAVKDAGLNNPAKKAPEAIAQEVDNGNASKGAKASDLLNNSDKETIGVEKKVSAEAIRQKIEVLNEQVERLNEQKGDLSAEELQKLEKINKRQAELNAKVEVSDLLNNSGENAAVNANLPKKNQAQGDTVLDQSKEALAGEARLNPEEHKEQQAQAPGLSNNTDKSKVEDRKEASAKNLQQALSDIDILNKTIEVTEQNKKALEKRVYKELEVIDKQQEQAPGLSNNTDKSKVEDRKEASAKNLQQALSNIDILNKAIEVTEQNKKALEKMVYKELEVMDKQQAKAPDLLKNSGKTESQESSKEGKGLFSKVIQGAIQIVKRMFRNVLAEGINAYKAEKKDHGVAEIVVHGDNTVYNTSFVRINKQEFNLDPGINFHRQSEGVDIRITYDTQHTVPGVMNLNINGTKCDIQPGKFARYRNHELEVDVVYCHQQNMNIGQSSTINQRNVENVQKKALEHGTVLNGKGVENVQAKALKDIKPYKTPIETEKKGGGFCVRL